MYQIFYSTEDQLKSAILIAADRIVSFSSKEAIKTIEVSYEKCIKTPIGIAVRFVSVVDDEEETEDNVASRAIMVIKLEPNMYQIIVFFNNFDVNTMANMIAEKVIHEMEDKK